MDKTISVGLADGNPLMLGALSEVVEKDPRTSLIATAKSAEAFIDIALRAQIDIGIIDWTIPTLGGEKLLEVLRAQRNALRIVVYSHDPSADAARRAMAAGAAGFCSRNESPDQLLDVVADVARGRMVFPFVDVRSLQRDPLDALTAKERAVLDLLAKGHSNRQLASEMEISLNTVKYHLRSIFEKLDVNSRTQAIALYYSSPAARMAED